MNSYQQELVENPPAKSPYFTLPDPRFFLTFEDVQRASKKKGSFSSVIDLFGAFEKMSDDQQTQFLLTLLQHSAFTPDYEAMAKALNLANASHVRRRFAAIVDKQGFEMDNDTMKASDGNPVTLAKKSGFTTGTPPSRRKVNTNQNLE